MKRQYVIDGVLVVYICRLELSARACLQEACERMVRAVRRLDESGAG